MDTSKTSANTFLVGVCMAGAVSAGAYTAGVMDYLLEALEEWEKQRGQPGVPTHKVQIPIIGGASAGGMTGIVTSSALYHDNIPIDKPTAPILQDHPENKFYNSWVDLTGPDMFSKMLDISDITAGQVLSALNSNFIDEVAQKVVSDAPATTKPLPSFIAPDLKVFTTLSNLEGFEYNAGFKSASIENNKYLMVVHSDFACFELTDGVSGTTPGWIPLNYKTGLNLDVARKAAMATGAFPVGLKSRLLQRKMADVNAMPFDSLHDVLANTPITEDPYESLNVDGGMINNEPFEKVRDLLHEISGQSSVEKQRYATFNSTVLMIEPFPTKKEKAISKDQNLLNVVGLTLSAMISQMRTKPIHIADALDETCAEQYLIAPSRKVKDATGADTDLIGELAIACGALNGFGGFINKEFRVHDYFLGRYNCKIFLRDYFTIPAAALEQNLIFKNGYQGVDKSKFKSTHDDSYQIIPIVDDKTDYTFPDIKFSSGTNWPSIQNKDIDQYQSAISKRIQAILLNFTPLSSFSKGLLWIGAKILLNRTLTDAALSKIKSSLTTWKLLK
jgi:predicted acylesterase/phospholipase RssA